MSTKMNNISTTEPDRVGWLVEMISKEIMDGSLQQGEKLNEPRLSRRFGVSRAPLREAIGRLEGRRLVVRTPRLGARVAVFAPRESIQLFHIREGLEGISARLAAERISDSEISALEAVCERQRTDDLSDDALLELDMNFHRMIAIASGSSFLEGILGNEFYVFYKMMRRGYRMLADRRAAAIVEHDAILNALKSHDSELAEFLMRRHITGARKSFESAMSDKGLRLAEKTRSSQPTIK
jgi:DNA-binding GntR family transcriptional regulator